MYRYLFSNALIDARNDSQYLGKGQSRFNAKKVNSEISFWTATVQHLIMVNK